MNRVIFTWMDENLNYDKEKVVLIGQSNGGIGAFHTIISQPERFHSLIALPGVYQGPVENLQKLENKNVWLIVGGQDGGWRTASEKMHEVLTGLNVQSRLNVLPGQGHVLNFNPADIFDWIEKN